MIIIVYLLDFVLGFATVDERVFFVFFVVVVVGVPSSFSLLSSSSSSSSTSSSVVGAGRLHSFKVHRPISQNLLLCSLLFFYLCFRGFLHHFLHWIDFEIGTNGLIKSMLLSTDLYSNGKMFFDIC